MSRGKYAVKAAKRDDARHWDHVDHLTERLTEAKLRARQVERDAAALPHVQKKLAELEQKVADDAELQEIFDKALAYSKALKKAYADLRALQRALCEAAGDLLRAKDVPMPDFAEYIARRWPGLVIKDSHADYVARWGVPNNSLSEDAVRRIQKARGQRLVTPDGDDAADLFIKKFAPDVPTGEDQ